MIRNPARFRWYARLRGLGSSLKTGVYLLPQDAPWSDVVATLKRGHGVEVRWTVREGLMLSEVADLAAEQLGIRRDSMLAAASDPALRRELGLPETATDVEGYLFPTTYVVGVHITGRELVRVMTREFLAQWRPEWTPRLDSQHLTRQQLVTLASIIEAEVRYDPDRPFVSAVYRNRLKRGMKLEADPTVVYAHGPAAQASLGEEPGDPIALQHVSVSGAAAGADLPAGARHHGRCARSGPGAVLVLRCAAGRKHIFSVTYADHQAAIRAVKRMQSRIARAAASGSLASQYRRSPRPRSRPAATIAPASPP